MLVKLDRQNPCECAFEEEIERDILQSAHGEDENTMYKNVGGWLITYNIEQVVGVVER